MSAIAEKLRPSRPLFCIAGGTVIVAIAMTMALPNLFRSRASADLPRLVALERSSGFENVVADVNTAGLSGAKANPLLDTTRKTKRTTAMELLVKSPAEMSEKIRQLAESMGGFLVSSESGSKDSPYATLTIRVPKARFEEARAEIKKLAAHVETETVQANDVTREYVDMEARLRNLRAQEAQYLEIMRRATTVEETLKVSEKLSEVRSQIEQQQAEFNTLSKQVETVLMTISLRSEVEAQVFGLNWRPLYHVKVAARDALEALADYASAMTTIILFLPVAFLWTATVVVALLIAWRTLRWIGRFFVPRKPSVTPA